MKRRGFLQMLGLGAAGSILPAKAVESPAPPPIPAPAEEPVLMYTGDVTAYVTSYVTAYVLAPHDSTSEG